ncbi:MAG: sodium-dependent transporter, partial [Anaerotignaceae bacterium]
AFLAISGQLAAMGQNMDIIGGTFGGTAVAFGNNLWVIVAIIVSVAIMALGVSGGIEKANKIMMPTLFILFIGLGIYIATLPGATEGYKYIFTLNPAGLADPKLWIFAFGQAFFSLSIAGNGTVIYGSYLSKKENLLFSARNVAVFDTLAALIACFVIIPAMAVGGAELSAGGPGLMFIYLVNVFNGMPGGMFVGIIFYICVLFAGVSSLINLYEAPVATLQEKFGIKRINSVIMIGVAGCIVAICIQGIVEGWMDAVSIYACPLGAMIAGIMFFWVSGKEFAENAIQMGYEKPIPKWIIPLGRLLFVPMALIALIAGAIFGGIG